MQKTTYLAAILTGLVLAACAGVEKTQAGSDSGGVNAASASAMPAPSASVATTAPRVKLHHYTVVAGDTLWDISRRFLDDPWRWRELWQDNPAIRDPHNIYPGDTIRYVVDGRGDGHLTLSERALPVVKLTPQMREEPLPLEPVPTVNKVVLDKFLVRARVVDKTTLKQAPYILGSAERRLLGGAAPDEVYAMGLANDGRVAYSVYKLGSSYQNQDGDILGYELVKVADARLLRYGSPSLLRLKQTSYSVNKGDYVLPRPPQEEYSFLPQAPPAGTQGHILSVFGGIHMIGQYDSVALDLGRADDIAPGQVFAVLQPRDAQRDPRSGKLVQGFDRRAGLLMVYQVYDHVSHALVMEARVPLRVHDLVAAP